MEITRYISDLMFSNMYVLSDNGYSLIIDPFEHYMISKEFRPDMIIVTHEHYDHISGVNRIKQQFGIPLLCSEKCAQRLTDSKKNSARYFESFCQLQTYGEQDMSVPIDTEYTCQADLTFDEEIRFKWHGNELWLFALPGHSPGSIGLIVKNKFFFSGDSLFADREVELRFPGGSKRDWYEISEGKINSISDDVIVYPGHKEKFLMKERRKNGCI